MLESTNPTQFYQIEIGHHRLRMPGATREEAIARARQHLANEMPRLWDVIHTLEADRFQIRSEMPQRNLFE